LESLRARAEDSHEAALLALTALSLQEQEQRDAALPLLQRLRALQAEDGGMMGGAPPVEATALTVLAWRRANRDALFRPQLEKAAAWLCARREADGGFGSPWSTLLAIQALLAQDSCRQMPAEAAHVFLAAPNGLPAQGTVPIPARAHELIVAQLPPEAVLRPGQHRLQLQLAGDQPA